MDSLCLTSSPPHQNLQYVIQGRLDLQTTYGSTLSTILGRKGISSLPGRLGLPTAGSHHISEAQLPTHLLRRPDLLRLPSINGSVLKASAAH
jgi:hypothetical protein